jgi:hypothetical protein
MNGAANELQPQADRRCEECGVFGATEIAGRVLCPDCLANCGACCAGDWEEDQGT